LRNSSLMPSVVPSRPQFLAAEYNMGCQQVTNLMEIGVPQEIKDQEFRVALTPAS
jgi:hypothetical protein